MNAARPRPRLVSLDRRAELAREEDRNVRRGYALGFVLGLFMWLVVIAVCVFIVGVARVTQ